MPKKKPAIPDEPLWETTKIPRHYAKRIKALCEKSGQSLMYYVNAALDRFMGPEGEFTLIWEPRFRDLPPLNHYRRRRQPKPTRPKSH